MFTLLVVALLNEKIFAKKKNLKNGLPFSQFLLSCCDVLRKKVVFLYNKLGRTSYHSPSQNCPGRIFLFFFFFHSLPFNPGIFCEQRDLLFLWSRLYFPKKIFRFFFLKKKKQISHEKHSLFFFHQMFLASFLHHFLFLFITFRIRLRFSFPFLLDHLCSWSPSSWTHFSCTSLSIFLNNNFSFLLYQKKYKYSLFTCMEYLSMCIFVHTLLQIKTNLFVHFPFCCALFHMCLFLHVCRSFFDFSLFYSRVLKHFSFLFSFLNFVLWWSLFMYLFFFFFWKLCLVWTSIFSPFFKQILLLHALSLLFTKKQSFFLKSNVFFF